MFYKCGEYHAPLNKGFLGGPQMCHFYVPPEVGSIIQSFSVSSPEGNHKCVAQMFYTSGQPLQRVCGLEGGWLSCKCSTRCGDRQPLMHGVLPFFLQRREGKPQMFYTSGQLPLCTCHHNSTGKPTVAHSELTVNVLQKQTAPMSRALCQCSAESKQLC